MRKRQVTKIGNSWFIKLSPSDVVDFGFVRGDFVDLDDLQLIEQEVKKRRKSK